MLVGGVTITGLLCWGLATEFEKGDGGGDRTGLAESVMTQLAATGQVPALVAFLLAIIGILAWGHEYRHGMIRASLTAVSSRTSLGLAKFAVAGGWVALVAFTTTLLSALVGQLALGRYASFLGGSGWREIGLLTLYAVLLCWLAMAFTALTRSQAFALVTLFLWPLLVENLVRLAFTLVPGLREHQPMTRFLPFQAAGRIVQATQPARHGVLGDPLTALGGTIVFGALTLVLVGAALVLLRRRDA